MAFTAEQFRKPKADEEALRKIFLINAKNRRCPRVESTHYRTHLANVRLPSPHGNEKLEVGLIAFMALTVFSMTDLEVQSEWVLSMEILALREGVDSDLFQHESFPGVPDVELARLATGFILKSENRPPFRLRKDDAPEDFQTFIFQRVECFRRIKVILEEWLSEIKGQTLSTINAVGPAMDFLDELQHRTLQTLFQHVPVTPDILITLMQGQSKLCAALFDVIFFNDFDDDPSPPFFAWPRQAGKLESESLPRISKKPSRKARIV